ncbi:ABC transporter permease [Geodermatophilus sp. SYSU D00703]
MSHTLTPATTPAPASQQATGRSRIKALVAGDKPYVLYLAFVVLLVAFSISSPVFLSVDNFLNIGRQTTLVSIIAVGMTFVIVSAQIDLSVGSTLALSGMVAALAMQHVSNNWLVGAVGGLVTGGLVGWVNGVLTARLLIPSFLVTLGMLGVARGVSLLLTNTKPVVITNPEYFAIFGEGYIAGIPAPIAWTILAFVVGGLLLHGSSFGRRVFATGGNATAARYSGINTKRTTTTAFVLTGMLAGLAALVLTARSHAARPDFAAGLELDVIAAVILGGTSLFGGRGLILGTLLGSLIIGVLNNGLVLLGVSSALQLIIKGVIIVAAVAFTRR